MSLSIMRFPFLNIDLPMNKAMMIIADIHPIIFINLVITMNY